MAAVRLRGDRRSAARRGRRRVPGVGRGQSRRAGTAVAQPPRRPRPRSRAGAGARRGSRRRGRRTEHVRGLRVGPRPGEARVRRAQGELLPPLITVAGAGMAGLVAAARARELGADVRVLEKGDRAGGSMLLSSGVVWRYRELDDYLGECPDGDESLQTLVWERLPEALDWLERLVPGMPHVTNPLTIGRRFDTHMLAHALVEAAGEIEYGRAELPSGEPLILATGGYPVALARGRDLLVRSNPWSDGGGIAFAVEHGATRSPSDEFYGRALPGPVPEGEFVAAAQ